MKIWQGVLIQGIAAFDSVKSYMQSIGVHSCGRVYGEWCAKGQEYYCSYEGPGGGDCVYCASGRRQMEQCMEERTSVGKVSCIATCMRPTTVRDLVDIMQHIDDEYTSYAQMLGRHGSRCGRVYDGSTGRCNNNRGLFCDFEKGKSGRCVQCTTNNRTLEQCMQFRHPAGIMSCIKNCLRPRRVGDLVAIAGEIVDEYAEDENIPSIGNNSGTESLGSYHSKCDREHVCDIAQHLFCSFESGSGICVDCPMKERTLEQCMENDYADGIMSCITNCIRPKSRGDFVKIVDYIDDDYYYYG